MNATTKPMRHALNLAVLFFILTMLGGCAGKSPYLLHPDDHASASTLEALRNQAARQPGYDTANRLAWATWYLTNDTTQARRLFDVAIGLDPNPLESLAGAGLAAFLQADISAAQAHFLALLERDARGPYGELAAVELRGISQISADFPAVAGERLAQVYDTPGLSSRTRQVVREILLPIAAESGNLEWLAQLEGQEGRWTRYAISGPFGDFGLLDFDTNYPPQTGEPLQVAYTHEGRAVASLPVDTERAPASFSDLSPYGGVYYATGYFRLENDTDLVLRLTSENLTQVLVNDHPVLTRDIRRAFPEGTAEAGIRLSAGWHKLQVKAGLERASGGFSLQILNDQGYPVALDQMPAQDGEHHAAYRAQAAPRPVPVPAMERVFFERAGRDPNFHNLFLAALVAGELNYYTPFKRYFAQALRINDRFAALHVIAALSLGSDPAQPGVLLDEFVRAAHTRAVELDETQAFARAMLLGQKLSRDQVREALDDLEILSRQSPGFYMWPMYRFSIYRSHGWIAEADEALAQSLALNPRNRALLEVALEYHRSLHRYGRVEDLVLRLSALDPRGLALADWKLEGGDLAYAQQAYEQAYAEGRDRNRHLRILADLYLRGGQTGKAVALIEEAASGPGRSALRLAPKLADLYLLDGRPEDSRRLLEDALEKEPHRFDLRRMLAFADARELLDSHVTDGLELVKRFEQAPFSPDDASVIVLDEYIRQYFPDGASISRVHTITRLQTKESLDEYGEVTRPVDAVLYQLRVIKPDGRVLVPDRISGKRSVTLPQLEIGDYVEIDYVMNNGLDPRIHGGRMDMGKFYFRMINLPVYLSNVVIIRPEGLAVNFQELNFDGLAPARETVADGQVTRHYRYEALTPIRTEPFMPMEDEVIPILYQTRPFGWQELQRFHRQRLATSRIVTPELQEFLDEQRLGLKGRDLVEHLFTVLADEIEGENVERDFITPASHVLLDRRGNRLLLLSTLLTAAGIPNDILLVRPQNTPDIEYMDANLNVFDEPLLRVQVPGETLYLTSELQTSVFNLPSPLLSGARALVLGDGDELFTRLPNFTLIGQNKEVHLMVTLERDGSATCDVVERAHNYYSGHMRRALKRIPADRIGQLFEMQVGRDFPGATLTEYEIRNVDDPQKPLELHYSFTVRHLARVQPGGLRLPLGFFKLNLTSNYIRTASREHDMLINHVNTGYNSVVVNLPPGMVLSRPPEPFVVDSPFGRYELSLEGSPKKLVFSRDYTIPIQRVSVSDFVDFYRFCAQVDQLERGEVLLVVE